MIRRLGCDVEPACVEPSGGSRELVVFQTVRHLDEILQAAVGGVDAGTVFIFGESALSGIVGLNGCGFEFEGRCEGLGDDDGEGRDGN